MSALEASEDELRLIAAAGVNLAGGDCFDQHWRNCARCDAAWKSGRSPRVGFDGGWVIRGRDRLNQKEETYHDGVCRIGRGDEKDADCGDG